MGMNHEYAPDLPNKIHYLKQIRRQTQKVNIGSFTSSSNGGQFKRLENASYLLVTYLLEGINRYNMNIYQQFVYT